MSVRLAKGLYYRAGQSRGHYVTRTGIVHIATGDLILTSKRLVFSGHTAFSIPLPKILHAAAYSDGIEIVKDSTAQNNKPFIFLYSDGELLNSALSACLNL